MMMVNRFTLALLLLWVGCVRPLMAQPSEADRKAFARVKESADKGSAEAQLHLGTMYADGVGVKKDLAKAAKWHRRAAEQGLARAQFELGLDYLNGDGVKPDPEEAVSWFRKAAGQQLVDAECELGVCCLSGRGTRQNGPEAVEWFRKAAAQGSAYAEYQIGNCYFEGTGLSKDVEESIKYFRGAAQKGVAAAQDRLGACYEKGQGVPKDYVRAYKWFAIAAGQDDAHALDIKVSLARLESLLSKDQLTEAQRMANNFKPGQADDLAAPLPSGGSVLPPEQHSERTDSASVTGASTGRVDIKGDDQNCEIFVDGAFVGNAPAKLKLTEGSHVIEVKKTGYKDYRRDLKVLAGSDLTLAPAFEKP